MRKPLNTILVKPSGPDCNLECAYCFYRSRDALYPGSTVHRMNRTILEAMIRQAMEGGEAHVNFAWQGGEPTLMGLSFFESAVEFQARYGKGKSVANALQTNGLLLTRAWAAFLKRYHFLVGLSLDGPRDVHDHYRVNKGGKGSWRHVAERARMLLDQGVAVNALTVVNDYSARFPDAIYTFHRDMGLKFMQFIPCVETDPADPTRAAPYSVTPEAYGEFLVRMFDLWQADFDGNVETTSVRFFDDVFYRYLGLEAPDCTLAERCGAYVVVEHNGDVYSCDFFVEPAWKLGNLMETPIADMLNSSCQDRFSLRKAILPGLCTTCRWRRLCRGGCTKDRVRDPRDGGINHFCKSFMTFFEHADARFTELADAWKRERATRARAPE